MAKSFSFETSPEVAEALEAATALLRARRPGQSISRSDTCRIALLSLAASLQPGANPDMSEGR